MHSSEFSHFQSAARATAGMQDGNHQQIHRNLSHHRLFREILDGGMGGPSVRRNIINFYTGLKFGSKTHFYGRAAPGGILANAYENGPFYGRGAADANFSF